MYLKSEIFEIFVLFCLEDLRKISFKFNLTGVLLFNYIYPLSEAAKNGVIMAFDTELSFQFHRRGGGWLFINKPGTREQAANGIQKHTKSDRQSRPRVDV